MVRDDVPNRYDGPNADLVNEVIEFAFSDRVFSSVGPDERWGSLMIVTDIRRAVDAAGGRGPESQFAVERAAMHELMNLQDLSGYELELNWYDLQARLLAKYIWTSRYYPWSKEHEEELRVLQSMGMRLTANDPWLLFEHLKKRLPEGPPGPDGSKGYYRTYIASASAADLMHCAENRAFNGMTENYWETLFRTYQMGLWPCGWHGTWPAPGGLMAWRRAV